MQYFNLTLAVDITAPVVEHVTPQITVVHAYNTNKVTGTTMVRAKSRKAAVALAKSRGWLSGGKGKDKSHE